MPVAPSFKSYKLITPDPFCKNGKMYVTVEHPNTKNHRDVRWYSEAEFAKNYGAKLAQAEMDESIKKYGGIKTARGFKDGPILVIRRNRPEDEEWLRRSCARYAVGVGWFIASTDTLPDDAPKHLKYILLGWEEVKARDNDIKEPNDVAAIISKKMINKEWFNINGC